jgi:cell division protein DivIC
MNLDKSNIKYILASIILLIASISFIKTTFQIMKSSSRLETLKNEVYELEIKKADLRKEISYQKTDEYIEREARNKLNMVRPNELVYVVDPELEKMLETNDVLSESAVFDDESRSDTSSNIRKWVDLLF